MLHLLPAGCNLNDTPRDQFASRLEPELWASILAGCGGGLAEIKMKNGSTWTAAVAAITVAGAGDGAFAAAVAGAFAVRLTGLWTSDGWLPLNISLAGAESCSGGLLSQGLSSLLSCAVRSML